VKYSGILHEQKQGVTLMRAMWEQVQPLLKDGKRLRIEIKPETRSLSQNDHFHKLCDIAEKSGLLFAGKPRTAKQWKVLFVSGHAVATKEQAEIVPGIEGEFVNIRESTALMSVARSSSLIEYTLAFLAMHGIATAMEPA